MGRGGVGAGGVGGLRSGKVPDTARGRGRQGRLLEEVVPETQGQIGADLEEAGGGGEAERGPFHSETHPVCI